MKGAALDARPFLKYLTSSDIRALQRSNRRRSRSQRHFAVGRQSPDRVQCGFAFRQTGRAVPVAGLFGKTRRRRRAGRESPAPTTGRRCCASRPPTPGPSSPLSTPIATWKAASFEPTSGSPTARRAQSTSTISSCAANRSMRSFANSPNAEQLAARVKLDPNVVSFSRLHAQLSKTGIPAECARRRDRQPEHRLDARRLGRFPTRHRGFVGVFVPAYGVNNLFGRLPVLGLLLGGQQEGLFGLNFRVTGRVSDPSLSVNPLSAIAPGFLRKIFGVLPLPIERRRLEVLNSGF